jgi:hypothetical protein
MPHPLSSLTPNEQQLFGALAAEPLDTLTPHILADTTKDEGEEQRSLLLRQTRLPLLELLRGQALTEGESDQVATRIRSLLANTETEQQAAQAAEVERELSTALESPKRGDTMLQLLDNEGHLDLQRLQEQYDFQVTLLASLDLLEDHNGHLGITGIDHRFHLLPSLDVIQSRLQAPALRRKVAQGFNQLLLVPFALPLTRLIDAWKRDLLRNEHLLHAHGGLDRTQPVWVWDGYEREDPVYSPQRFARNHGGRTKAQLLDSDPAAGWQVLLTEAGLTDLPRAGQGQTLARRPQIEAGRTPHQYLADCPKDEVGWTPETYIAAFCTALERTGRPLDVETVSRLTASYLPDSGYVPNACWYSGGRRANLGRDGPDFGGPYDGARPAVRVV